MYVCLKEKLLRLGEYRVLYIQISFHGKKNEKKKYQTIDSAEKDKIRKFWNNFIEISEKKKKMHCPLFTDVNDLLNSCTFLFRWNKNEF